jgi:uncharacterized protein (DUF305 family)
MPSITARVAAVIAALATATLLSSCSSSPSTGEHADRTTAATSGQPAGYNADDVAFATNMIPHHQQAIDMAALVADRSSNPEVIQLASQIAAAQQPEIQTMKVFLVQWKENPDADTGGHSGHAVPMQGMVDDATMARLQSLNSPEFDTLWLQSMIAHHQGAIEMAKAEIANGDNVDAIGMAKNIVATQEAEIGQMKQMLGG